ncbi:MAG: ABC transporter permease subunit [Streptosporangiales bacterium]|nr:ABC transporter permease subunit [Streptosporangiales bacterium]
MTSVSTPAANGRPSVAHVLGGWIRGRRGALTTFVVALFVFWQVSVPLLPTELIPYPYEVAGFMWDEIRGDTLAPHTVYQAFGITFGRLGIGFVLAVAIGVPVGLVMGMSLRFEAMFRDFLVVLLTIPYLVWALVFSMWLGFGSGAPVLTVTLTALPFIILNVMEGVRDVPRDLVDMANAFEMPRPTLIRHVIFPSQMPFVFAALRYGFANGWKGVVVAEVFGAADGAGWTIRYWYDAHRAQGVIGYALFFVLFSLVLERVVFGRLSKTVFRWRPAVADRASEN